MERSRPMLVVTAANAAATLNGYRSGWGWANLTPGTLGKTLLQSVALAC